MELTILMPCLNEEKTIAYGIEEASSFFVKSGGFYNKAKDCILTRNPLY
ncbi:MAG: hypothetical protein ACI4A3_13665 [Lachnospiraceae bacterium]